MQELDMKHREAMAAGGGTIPGMVPTRKLSLGLFAGLDVGIA